MNEEQIKQVEEALDCSFIKADKLNCYKFRKNKHFNIVVNFNVADKIISQYAATSYTSFALLPFDFGEMKNIVKVCKNVLGW